MTGPMYRPAYSQYLSSAPPDGNYYQYAQNLADSAEMVASFDGDHDQYPADDLLAEQRAQQRVVAEVGRREARESIRRQVDFPRPPQGATGRDISAHLDVETRNTPFAKHALGRSALDLAQPRATHVGRHSEVTLKGHADEESKGVKYIRDDAVLLSKYEVRMGPLMARRGRVFDTSAIYGHYRQSRTEGAPLAQGSLIQPFLSAGAVGRGANGAAIFEDFKESLIWACVRWDDGDSVFFSHVCKFNRFHHSSFNAGRSLVGAGQWVVKNGKLLRISAQSGHYIPTLSQLQQSVRLMTKALHADTQVLLFSTRLSEWTYMPALRFLYTDLTGYKAHPQEQG